MRQLSLGTGHGQHKTEPGRGEPGRLCTTVAWAPGLVKISYRGTENQSPREHGIPLSEGGEGRICGSRCTRSPQSGHGGAQESTCGLSVSARRVWAVCVQARLQGTPR